MHKLNICMNKYLLPVLINGQIIKTAIYAYSPIHAKLLGQWRYGFGSVPAMPTKLDEAGAVKPPTPEQARVKSLQAQADRAKQAVKAEKARQAMAKAQKPLGLIG
jgi:hypothetical protein